jgi:DnaJ-class molecular chaperone
MNNTAYFVVPGIGFFIALAGWIIFHVQSNIRAARRGITLKYDIDISPKEVHDEATILIKVDDRDLQVKLSKQISTGTRIRLAGAGRSKKPDGERGDLYLYAHVKEDLVANRSEFRPLKEHAADQFDRAALQLREFLVGKQGNFIMDRLQHRRQILVLGEDQHENGDKMSYFLSGNGLKRSVKRKDGTESEPEPIGCEAAIRSLVRSRLIAPQDCVRWIQSQIPLI